jgi:CheY-like chemotaxis protein
VDNLTVLVAEDDQDIQDLLCELLALRDFRTIRAANGGEALDQARAEAPDLCLLDIRMPVLDAHEVLAELRRDPATAHLPVLFCTATVPSERAGEDQQAAARADGYVRKPFTAKGLFAEIDRVLHARGTSPAR